jgi:hypothetical protein
MPCRKILINGVEMDLSSLCGSHFVPSVAVEALYPRHVAASYPPPPYLVLWFAQQREVVVTDQATMAEVLRFI